MPVIFYLLALLLAVLAVCLVVPVILRGSRSKSSNRRQENIEVAKQRLAELKQRENTGQVDPEDAAQIREEIETELFRDVQNLTDSAETVANSSTGATKWVAIAVSISVPLGAGVLYLLVGEPSGVTIKSAPSVAVVQESEQEVDDVPGVDEQDLEQLTQRLMTHLATNTDDALGWSTLGQLFIAQQRYAEAAGAYKKVRELQGDSAEYLVREADARAMANDGVLQGQPESLILAALEIEPDNTGGLWLAGLAAGERGDVEAAMEYWQRAEQTTNNEEMLNQLRQLIEAGTAELARVGISASSNGDQTVDPVIKVQVSIESSILSQINPDDTVFVIARAFNGPPAPLAAVKKQVKDLPISLELDDSLAMLPNLNISSFEQVLVIARVSRSGTAQSQSGDFFGQSEPVRPGVDQAVVEIVISEQVP
ncbi:MAG: c-type cytochrome biogenesis protein CcmI [Gammaproteobacteria bacterium]|nr:c-type cytochrome biogenesis protein CcmI [Gammaproteobacteria bacterium]